MTTFHNIDYQTLNFEAVQGDGINFIFDAQIWDVTTGAWIDFDLSGLCVDMQVRRQDGLLLKDWHSCPSPAEILVSGHTVQIVDDSGIMEAGFHNTDIQYRDPADNVPHTFVRGLFKVTKQVTV